MQPTPPASNPEPPASNPQPPASNPEPPASNPTPPASEPQPPGNTVSITGFVQQAMARIDYLVNTVASAMSGDVFITLPPEGSVQVGDLVRAKSGTGANLANWRIVQNAGQWISTKGLPGSPLPGQGLTPYQAPAGAMINQNWWFVASSADGEKLAAVANNIPALHAPNAPETGAVWTSADAGVTWTRRGEPGQPGEGTWVSIASSADGTKLAAVGFYTGIWTSGDSGSTWTNSDFGSTSLVSEATQFVSISMSADGSRMVAATVDTEESSPNPTIQGNGRIYTFVQEPGQRFGIGAWTREGGAETTHQWRGVAMSADGVQVVAAAYRDDQSRAEGVYVSNDSGKNWTQQLALLNDSTAYRVAISRDGSRMIMAERFGRIYTSANAGLDWSAGSSEAGFNAVAASADGLIMMAVQASGFAAQEGSNPPPERNGKLLVSTDGGATWIDRAAGSPRWWRGAAISGDGNRLIAAVDGGPIFVSTSNRTTLGTTGYLTGGPGDELQLEYLGNGIFRATSNAGPAYTVR